ncbi:hypothetical protein NPX79_02085 [Spiroplasma endosymbiont of Anurida maritima]|uniref:hypothetical protein n=1 Tax=Spiroplasma endosymbiont of Anurida maritima TaxID=2967972 RepID=UPI0036D385D5
MTNNVNFKKSANKALWSMSLRISRFNWWWFIIMFLYSAPLLPWDLYFYNLSESPYNAQAVMQGYTIGAHFLIGVMVGGRFISDPIVKLSGSQLFKRMGLVNASAKKFTLQLGIIATFYAGFYIIVNLLFGTVLMLIINPDGMKYFLNPWWGLTIPFALLSAFVVAVFSTILIKNIKTIKGRSFFSSLTTFIFIAPAVLILVLNMFAGSSNNFLATPLGGSLFALMAVLIIVALIWSIIKISKKYTWDF